ncbi:hypothetical protein MWS69_002806 [Citrobacter amalonaticus]
MTTITRERLLKIQRWRETYGPGSNVVLPAEEAEELARIALASLDAKARKVFTCTGCGAEGLDEPLESRCHCGEDGARWVESVVYTSPPAPVSVPDYPENLPCPVILEPGLRFGKGVHTKIVLDALQRRAEYYAELDAMTPEQRAEHDAGMKAFAAMLQSGQPVSNRDELPLDYLQGHKDGLEWAAQLAKANHPETGDWLYDDPIELSKAIRKGPDMPELKSAFADEDDNFYSWFGRFWHENYQQNNYTTSAKQMLGTMAEFAFRAGRESATQAGNSPVIPDGYALVPKRLTAENFAKAALSGEFSETKFINCPECFGDDECETCDGSGRIEISVPVSWTNIKAIWAKGVELFAAVSKQEAL